MEKQVEGRALDDTNIKLAGGEIGPGKGGKAIQNKGIWTVTAEPAKEMTWSPVAWQWHKTVPDNTLYQGSGSKFQIFIKLV